MKKLIITTLGLFIINLLHAQVSNSQIVSFAKKNYMTLLGNIPENNLGEYGMKDKGELKNLKFSTVFTEYSNQNNKLTLTQNYRVLVLNNNKPCGLLTIFNSDNKLSVADFGALELSKELMLQNKNIKFKTPAIFRSYANQCDYLFDGSINNSNAAYYKLFTKSVFKFNEVINSQN